MALNSFFKGYCNSVHKVPKLKNIRDLISGMPQSLSAWSATFCMSSNNWYGFLDEFCLEIHRHHQHAAVTVLQ